MPPAPVDQATSSMANRNARIGLILFVVYLAFYGGFVLLAAFSPATMAKLPWAGVNLAIWYGFALIAAALLLALIYGYLCRIEVPSEPGRPAPGAREISSTNASANKGGHQ